VRESFEETLNALLQERVHELCQAFGATNGRRSGRATDKLKLTGTLYSLISGALPAIHAHHRPHLSRSTADVSRHRLQCEPGIALETCNSEIEPQIVGIAYDFLDPATQLADVAFLVRDPWQGKGLGTILVQEMMIRSKERSAMMRALRRSALILLVAGILGVLWGVLWLLATRTNDSGVGTPALEPTAGVVDAQSVPSLDTVSATASSRDRALVSPADGEGGKDAPALDEDVGWRVCVVDARTIAPVVGATVSVTDSYAIGRELNELGIGSDTIEGRRLHRERAVEARTGPDGCARFSAPPEHALVEARSGTDWAFAVVNQAPENHCVTLKLSPDRVLLVRVVDGAGTPVGGVPVAVRRAVDAQPTFSFKWTDTQTSFGVATFLHFQRRLEQGPGWHALLAFPVRDQALIPVDEHTPLDPPITLVLPDTGRVRVRVRAVDGGLPDLDGVDLHVDAFDGDSGTSRLWPDGPWARPHINQEGEALLPWIGLGLRINAALVRDMDEVVARSLAGPARAGEEVVCDLVWSRTSLCVVTGRFVFRDGRAWPAAKVSAYARIFPTPSPSPLPRDIEVRSDGRFRMPVHDARPASGTRAFRFAATHPENHGQVIAVVPLDRDIPPDGLDLGDVVLDFGELLVSGRVVDEAHRPIAGASSYVHTRAMDSGETHWPRVQTAGTFHTADDGAFTLYLSPEDTQPSEELRLETQAAGFVTESRRDVRRGDRNVEVVLKRAGALAGWLLLDRGLVHDDVSLVLASSTRQVVMLRPDQTFEVLELSPGTYSLEVRRRGVMGGFEREPAAVVGDLVVRAGETCRDPRIQGLRIESVFTTLRIRVRDRASTPLEGAAVSIVGLRDEQPRLSNIDGVCLVRCETLPVDLDVSAFGYARQRIVNVSADREVVLDSGFPIRLRTSAKPSGGEPKYMLGVWLHSVDANGLTRGLAWGPEYTANYKSDRTHFDEHGEIALSMPAAGMYECDVTVTVLAGNMGRGGSVGLSPSPRIIVLANRAEQLFELTIPEDAVKAAVESALH
jgi:hypothetical protein